MKPILIIILLSTFAGIFTSCNDIIEPSISGRIIQPEAPFDQYQSTTYLTTFWWDTVNDALQYRLQIVSPSFQSTGVLIADTLVKANKLNISIPPGIYQWRVRAENGSTQTAFSTPRNFTIQQSTLQQQNVQLVAPANSFLTNRSSIVFQWANLYDAKNYRLEVDTNNFANEAILVYNQLSPNLQANFTLPKENTFSWRVRAENDTAKSQWSQTYQVTYDHTPPVAVSLVAPTNNQTLPLPANLQWSVPATATKYKLYVFKSDSTTLLNSNFPMLLNSNSYSFTTGNSGDTIYWKVTALDAAGNESQPSDLHKFIIQ